MQSLFASTFRIKTTTPDDPLNKVYAALPRDALVGGSYALKDLTDAIWEHNDVDVFVTCQTKEEFDAVGKTFKDKTKPHVSRDRWFADMSAEEIAASDLDEKFHKFILGTKTFYKVPGLDVPVQLICMRQDSGETLRSMLDQTVDLPACVTFSLEPLADGTFKKRFEVPQFGLQAVTTRIICPRNLTCRRRIDKYSQRGYLFY